MSAASIHNLVRGLTKPYVGAHFNLDGKAIKVWETELVINSEKNIEPGKVISVDEEGVVVKTGDNAIRLIKTEPFLDITQGSYL
jgi:methionyl-tRNA formyltransferase